MGGLKGFELSYRKGGKGDRDDETLIADPVRRLQFFVKVLGTASAIRR